MSLVGIAGGSLQLPLLDAGCWFLLSQLAQWFKLVGHESEPSVLCCQQKCREDKDTVARLLSFVLQHPSKPYFVNGNQIKLSNITAVMSLPNDDGLK